MDLTTRIYSSDGHLVPPAWLPTELLAKVFAYYTAAHGYLNSDPEAAKNRLGTVFCIMLVCHRWREVALGTPELWSVFTATRSTVLLDTILERSKNHPLAIELQLASNDPDEEACRQVFSHFTRIRHLRLSNFPASFLEKFVPRCGPLLQSLTLDVAGDYSERWEDAEGAAGIIEKLDLPALRELRIDSLYLIHWTSPFLRSSLTRLHLVSCVSNQFASFADVFKALEAMPLLQYLELESALPWSFNQNEVGSRSVRLSDLRSIVIVDESAACAGLLETLVFPSSARIEVTASETWGRRGACWPRLLAAITNKLAEKPGQVDDAPFLGAHIQCGLSRWDEDDSMDVKIHCYRTPCSLKVIKTDSDPFCTFLHSGDPQKDFRVQFIQDALDRSGFVRVETLLRALPLAFKSLRCLALSAPDSSVLHDIQPNAETWMEYFQSMTSLRELIVKGWGVETLPEVLTIHAEPSQAQEAADTTETAYLPGRTPKLFPQLERLTVLLPRASSMDSEHILTRFHAALVARRALGMRLQESIGMYSSDWTETENVTPSETLTAVHIRYSWFPEGTENTHIPCHTPEKSHFGRNSL